MKPTKLVFFNYGTEYINEHTGTCRKNKYGQEKNINHVPEQEKRIVLKKFLDVNYHLFNCPEDTKVIY